MTSLADERVQTKFLGGSNFKQIVIVTGTPGIGKTSVSKQLAANLKGLHIDLGELVKREGLMSGYVRKKQTRIVDENKLAARLRQMLKQQKGVVVVDGHYATSVVARKQIERVFVLRRDPRQLRKMMEKRGFTGEKLRENLASEVLDVVLFEAMERLDSKKLCEIDTTDKTVDDTVKDILSFLRGERKCSVGVVDWIGKLEREGVLDEYLW